MVYIYFQVFMLFIISIFVVYKIGIYLSNKEMERRHIRYTHFEDKEKEYLEAINRVISIMEYICVFKGQNILPREYIMIFMCVRCRPIVTFMKVKIIVINAIKKQLSITKDLKSLNDRIKEHFIEFTEDEVIFRDKVIQNCFIDIK